MNDDKIIVAIQQHKNIRGKIKALYENDITDTFLLQQLAEDLNHHIRYEERVLFPFFEKALSESQLRHIGLTLENSHTNKYNENYSDEFWLQKK